MTEAGARKKNPTRREKALDSTEFLIDDEAQGHFDFDCPAFSSSIWISRERFFKRGMARSLSLSVSKSLVLSALRWIFQSRSSISFQVSELIGRSIAIDLPPLCYRGFRSPLI